MPYNYATNRSYTATTSQITSLKITSTQQHLHQPLSHNYIHTATSTSTAFTQPHSHNYINIEHNHTQISFTSSSISLGDVTHLNNKVFDDPVDGCVLVGQGFLWVEKIRILKVYLIFRFYYFFFIVFFFIYFFFNFFPLLLFLIIIFQTGC